MKGHHNLLAALVEPRSKQTNDGCSVESLESVMVKVYMWHYHYARGKCRAEFSMPDDLFFKTEPENEMRTICRYALLDSDVDQIVALNTQRVADLFDYITTHRDELIAELREADSQRADEVEKAFASGQPLAKTLWPKLERIVAFGAGEYYEATAHMKQFTGEIPGIRVFPGPGCVVAFGAGEMYEATNRMKQFTCDVPHNNGYYYTEETIYGRAVADDSDLFETFPSGSFHEYLPQEEHNAATIFSTNAKSGEPYQLVVTNSAGLYRYVTDHIVCIQETQMDKVLFTIY